MQLVFPSPTQAVQVLAFMQEVLDIYDHAITVEDLYASIGHPVKPEHKTIGWRTLENFSVEPCEEGYLLTLTEPVEL